MSILTYKIPFRTVGLLSLVALFTASGCKMYETPSSTNDLAKEALPEETLIPENWTVENVNSDSILTDWHLQFGDELLNGYISEAIDSANPSIVSRLAAIRASEANVTLARSGRAFYLNYGANYQGNFASGAANSQDARIGLSASWEADLWGRIGAGIEAANENVIAQTQQLSLREGLYILKIYYQGRVFENKILVQRK